MNQIFHISVHIIKLLHINNHNNTIQKENINKIV
jgi:hypothetical protein